MRSSYYNQPMARSFLPRLSVGLCILICTLIVYWPIVTDMESVTTSNIDGLLIAWLVDHAARALRGARALFQVPFFYPFQNTLTYSDPFVSSGLLANAIRLLAPKLNLIAHLDLQLILGTIGFYLSTFWLIRVLGQNRLTSLLLATIATFVPLQFNYVVHLHTHLLVGIPFGLACTIRYLHTQKWRCLTGYFIAFMFQALNAPLTAYFFLAVVSIYLIVSAIVRKQWLVDLRFSVITGLMLVASAIFYIPYWQQAIQMDSARTIRDAAHFSFSLNRLVSWDIIGLVGISVLLIVSTRHKTQLLRTIIPWLLIALIGLIMMLGPVLKIDDQTVRLLGFPITLTYAVFYYVVPGLKAFRAVTRWSTVANLGLVLLIATALPFSRVSQPIKLGLLAVLALFSIISAKQSLPLFSIDSTVPEMYKIAAQQSETSVAILPAYVWSMTPYYQREAQRLLFQPTVNKLFYNGYSGFLPPSRSDEIHQLFTQFPSDASLQLIKQAGVQLLLVEYAEYQRMYADHYQFGNLPAPNPSLIKSTLENRSDIELIACHDDSCLYRLVPLSQPTYVKHPPTTDCG